MSEPDAKKDAARQAILNNYENAAHDMMDAGMPVPGLTQKRSKGREFISAVQFSPGSEKEIILWAVGHGLSLKTGDWVLAYPSGKFGTMPDKEFRDGGA